MAGVWQLLPSLDPVLRLRIGTAVIAIVRQLTADERDDPVIIGVVDELLQEVAADESRPADGERGAGRTHAALTATTRAGRP